MCFTRFFRHRTLNTIFVYPSVTLQWQFHSPDGRRTRTACVHMYARHHLNQGKPEQECWLIDLSQAIVLGFLDEITREEAYHLDPDLVEYASWLQSGPTFERARLQRDFPLTAKLHFVDVAEVEEGRLFDVYRTQHLFETSRSQALFARQVFPLIYVNSIIAATGLLPTRHFEGATRVLVPFTSTEDVRCEVLLAQALAARIWGECAEVAYQYEVEYS